MCLDKDIHLWIDPSLDLEKDTDLVCLSDGLEIINHDGKMPLKKDSSQQITKGYTHQQATATARQKVKVWQGICGLLSFLDFFRVVQDIIKLVYIAVV